MSGVNPYHTAATNPNDKPAQMSSPAYSYTDHIKTPEELGSKAEGSLGAIVDNLNGMVDYLQVLLPGGGRAIEGCSENEPGCTLGNKYFVKTAQKCSSEGKSVTRSVYIDNVAEDSPLGDGIIPGMIHNASVLNPFALLGAFLSGPSPKCSPVTLPTGSFPDWGEETAFLTDADISSISPCAFSDKQNPVTGHACHRTEGFSRMHADKWYAKDKKVALYHGAVALLGLYIVLKLIEKEHKR
tara:strand:- start:737 stop:1459 length:723 start_codon:yes stop_codon:yes gene_type:complete